MPGLQFAKWLQKREIEMLSIYDKFIFVPAISVYSNTGIIKGEFFNGRSQMDVFCLIHRVNTSKDLLKQGKNGLKRKRMTRLYLTENTLTTY